MNFSMHPDVGCWSLTAYHFFTSVEPPPSSNRKAPAIRDHETLRMIGRGAYGEVWIARSVTGVMRAVKVVWRDDYDYQGAFEREFEAIKKYEPISRHHPGLVPILQVGRSDEAGFYYYVMELADDVESGKDIHPEVYRPKTMAAVMKKQGRLKAADCISHGGTVAEALHFLHTKGLIHRDVKPSNLIFIDGVCRLADIGLVALLGQRSFVGTEGFVAPEGPGTAQSDIFSLGMVLYEACTGKDRLDFPDLPSAKEEGGDIELWKRLNRVICRACAHQAADRFHTAQDMAQALRGERVAETRKWKRKALIAVGCVSLLGAGALLWSLQGGKIQEALHRSKPLVTIRSEPTGAEIYSNGQKLGQTPFAFSPNEDIPAIYQLRLAGYRLQEFEHTASKKAPAVFELKLEPSKLPQPGERWTNSLGMEFVPKQNGHETVRPVEMSHFNRFLKSTGRPFEGRVEHFQVQGDKDSAYIAVVPPADAEAFRSWLADDDRTRGFLTHEHHYVLETFALPEGVGASALAEPKDNSRQWQAFTLRVERQGYGSAMVRTNPPGVKVYLHDELLGISPVEILHVKTGELEVELRGEGFTDLIIDGDVKENELLELYADMEKRRGVNFGREWRNSLGMKFIPNGDILLAATETRRRDYLEYVKSTGASKPTAAVERTKSAQIPMVNVDREEARAFCVWLTKREREQNLIGKSDRYRLPTDEEWSRAVGLPLERGKDPAERNGRIRGVYPWGYEWPPPKNVDNFADESALHAGRLTNVIKKYQDLFPGIAAVTALPVGPKGFVGLAGNVSEWVDTDYEAAPTAGHPLQGTVRGGNWRSSNPDDLLSSARQGVPITTRRDIIGFRIALTHGAEEKGN